MTTPDPQLEATLALAEQVLDAVQRLRGEAVIIGALALAVHRYPRETADLDLATAIEPRQLEELAHELRSRGYEVTVHAPDAGDPLGGVVDVRAPGADLVQVVNFLNPPASGFPRLVADAAATATELIPGRPLRVVDLPHLIAFKLYAGGHKSQLDILELLDRNPDLDVAGLRELCRCYRLEQELEDILGMAGHR